MNARTLLPLAIVTAILSLSVAAHAADDPAPTEGALPDNDAQAKARAALYAEEPVPTQSAPSAVAPASKPEETQAATESAVAPVAEEDALAAAVTLPASQPDNEAQAKARAALYANQPAPLTAAEPQPAVTQPSPAVAPVVAASAAAPQAAETGTNPLTTGMAAPALPTDASQQQQLSALLQQYRSDQISASQYHSQRAAVLAGK